MIHEVLSEVLFNNDGSLFKVFQGLQIHEYFEQTILNHLAQKSEKFIVIAGNRTCNAQRADILNDSASNTVEHCYHTNHMLFSILFAPQLFINTGSTQFFWDIKYLLLAHSII